MSANMNAFQCNWVNAEVDANGVTIYQYAPGANFSVWRLSKDEPAITRGDVNKDGEVNIGDITALISHVLARDFVDGDQFSPANADVTLDGEWTVSDVTTWINFVLSRIWPD